MSPRSIRPHLEALDGRVLPSGMPTLGMTDATIVEGNSGTQYAIVTVGLSRPSAQTVTVSYGTADGTATTAGNDYLATSGKLSFAPGQTSKTLLVPILGDRIGDGDESFSVKLHGVKNASISRVGGTVTIVDDEPRLRIGDVSTSEGNDGAKLFTFTASLSAASDQAVTVDFATQEGTALAGEDYVATSGALTFAPGETTKTFTVAVLADATGELDETFFVNLSATSSNAFVADGQGRGTILDDDGGTDVDICLYVCCHPDGCGAPQDGSGIAP